MALPSAIYGLSEVIIGIPLAYAFLILFTRYKDGEFDERISREKIYLSFFLYVYSRRRTYINLAK
ncbi:MAG: hypothetical protein KA028_02530 [Candidatus Pacebacteria bacterium]|nr:hypothetical protein [Candidatus Paceibacterota bacterium]MBP9851663.1 hypothetical protein [Candidatus Paceibacterota bacterium]